VGLIEKESEHPLGKVLYQYSFEVSNFHLLTERYLELIKNDSDTSIFTKVLSGNFSCLLKEVEVFDGKGLKGRVSYQGNDHSVSIGTRFGLQLRKLKTNIRKRKTN